VEDSAVSRRHFMAAFSRLGLSATLLPGVLWSQLSAASSASLTIEMLKSGARLAGLEFSDAECEVILAA
jgi:hypothetical protein